MGAPQYEQAGADIGGTGTTNTIPRWTGPSTLGDSILTQSGTTIYQTGSVNGAVAFNVTNQNTGASAYSAVEIDSAGASWRLKSIRTAGMFAIERNGVVAVQIDNVLNVGIGTASPWAKTAMVATNNISTISFGFSFDSANNYRHGISTVFSSSSTTGNLMSFCVSDATATGFTRVLTLNGAGQAALGTTSFTTGRALTTVADLDVFGLTVGRGASGVSGNTAVGAAALASVTTGSVTVGVGFEALNALSTGAGNTAVGYRALWKVSTTNSNTAVGYLACANSVGAANTGIGQQALQGAVGSSGNNNTGAGYQTGLALTTGAGNTLLGSSAGDSITTGSSNIVIGYNADVAAAGDSNQLVLGDATNYVATNGGATTYYATAGASLGYMRVRLNGTYVKIEVFADV